MDVLIGKVARELAALEEQIDRALERAFSTGLQFRRTGDSFRPPLDVYETREALFVRVDLAGVRSEDIRLIVDGEYLQISGRRRLASEGRAERHFKMEISEGHFDRVLRLSVPYDAQRVSAKLQDGLLLVELPLASDAAPRRVPVKTEP